MRKVLLFFLVAAISWAQLQTIDCPIPAVVGGGDWTGRVTVWLNNPQAAQPLYYGSTPLVGYSQMICVGVTDSRCSSTTAAGRLVISLYANTTITPSGTSYSAMFEPTRGKSLGVETWVVDVGDTSLTQIRSSTIPTPDVIISPNQLSSGGAATGQYLQYSGSAWGPVTLSALSDPTTTAGDLIYRGPSGLVRLGIGTNGQCLLAGASAPSWGSCSTGGGITSLGGLTGAVQTFGNDTNVTMVSSGSVHTITWAGTLADGRIASAATWNAKQDGDADLTALAALASTGIVARTAPNSYALRAIAGTAGQITVNNGDGVAGPPTISLPSTITGLTSLSSTNFVGSLTGNASTSTAHAANGTNCSAGTFPLGVDASGNAEGCTALPTTIAGTANQITVSAPTGAITLSLPATITGLTSVSSTTFVGTLNGSASTLTTARAIYGNNFDGSAALTQIIASTFGGTGNGFTRFTGPTTSEKTFTLPNSSTTIITAADIGSVTNTMLAGSIDLTAKVTGILPGANGGTGNGFFAVTGPTTSLKTFTFPNASATMAITVAAGTAVLGTAAIAANTCASVVTVAATGTLSTDEIVATPNASLSGVTGYGKAATDGLVIYSYPTANNVNFEVCNVTGASITPGAATLNWGVYR